MFNLHLYFIIFLHLYATNCYLSIYYWIGQKVCLFFFFFVALAVVTFHLKQLLRLYCDTCHISMHLKKFIQIDKSLCSHFNSEDGRKTATFLAYYVLLFPER